MTRTSNRIMQENAIRILNCISEVSTRNRDHVAQLSYRQIALQLGLTPQQVRFLCGKLEARGYVVSKPRYAEDGGQLANGYALTSRGRMALREMRRIECI